MATGPERLTRWLLGHTQPKPCSLDLEHPAVDDIAWAADRIEMLESHIETLNSRLAELERWP